MSRYIALGEEGTYGTLADPIRDWIEAESETLSLVREHEDIAPVRSNSPLAINPTTEHVEGDIVVSGSYNECGLLLRHFYGGHTTTATAPTWTHVFPATGGSSGRSGYSLSAEVERETASLIWTYTGLKVVGWSLNVGASSSPKWTFNVKGKGETAGAISTAAGTYATFAPQTSGDATFTFDATTLPCDDLSISCTWGVDDPWALGSRAYAAEPIDNTFLMVEGVASVLLENTTQYAKYTAVTDVDVDLVVTDGTNQVAIAIPKARIKAAPAPTSGKDRIKIEYTFGGMFNTAATENVQVTLKNGVENIPVPAP